ncbi:MAG TPA: alpha/beta hydrolase [Actinomycetota bacterium]|jgi:pimeloyl-ACP methyl ester carboxylesterase
MSITSGELEPRMMDIRGAKLYVEERGTGPVLLCISGGPTDAGMFTDLAGRLADRYTVVSYDQRGHSRSTLGGEAADISVESHADDAAALLEAVGDEPAYVYGNSGGGTIGLDLVTRRPELVTTLVAHEPPLLEILPDVDAWRARWADIYKTYEAEGAFPAMGMFGAAVEEGGPKYSEEMQQAPPTPEGEEMGNRMMGNFDLFLAQELRSISEYDPDFDTLRRVSTNVVSAAGETSGEQLARLAAIELASRLGKEPAYLPGAHGGWGSDPQEFASRLEGLLRSGS